jgi:hypothetical protein
LGFLLLVAHDRLPWPRHMKKAGNVCGFLEDGARCGKGEGWRSGMPGGILRQTTRATP